MSSDELWDHQRRAVERAKGRKSFALFFDPGTGKTLTTITILRQLYNQHRSIMPTLILAPVITLQNWKREWELWSKVPPDRIIVLTGPTKTRLKKLRDISARTGGNFIAITNYEGPVANKQFGDVLLAQSFDAVVLDESHKIKNRESRRSKFAIKICDRAVYKYALTGTPILNSPMDIWTQFRALDGGNTFGKNFFAFRAKYFVDKNAHMPKTNYFPNWQMRKGIEEELNELIYKSSMRAIKSECLDLPPMVKKRVDVDMDAEQKRLYKEMKKDFIAFLNDTEMVAELAITKALRLQQIVSGIYRTEDREIIKHDIPRLKVLKELLEDIAPYHKVIVWCVFKGNYEQVRKLCTSIRIGFVEVHGSVSNTAKYNAVDEFNNDPNCRVFIGHPGSVGIGINLVSASYSIYYSRNFSLEYDTQSEARNYRGGSERHESITRIDLVATDTIDETVLEALDSKQKISDVILEGQWK